MASAASAQFDDGVDSGIRARAMASLYLAGAAIGALSLALPHPEGADDLALWSNVGLAVVGGFVVLAIGPRMPAWFFQLGLAVGSLLITRAVLASGDTSGFYAVWYLWIGLYAFYFFSRTAAAVHVTFASALYGITLIAHTPDSPLARWITTVTTLFIAGIFIDTLVRRAREQARFADLNSRLVTTVAEVAHELARVSDSEGARNALCAASARLAQATTVALWEPSTSGAELQQTGVAGPRPSQRALPFVAAPGGAVQAFTAGQPVIDENDHGSAEFTGDPRPPKAMLWQPVVRDNVPVAVLAFYWKDPTFAREAPTRALAQLLASEAGVTLERVELLTRLESIARTDDLTGLPNRRAWEEELPRELLRAKREGRPLCVAMIDLDHFKEFNDEKGHQAGDRFLKQAAAAWGVELRGTDVLARYGGEEFALALPNCTPEQALDVVERVRAATPDGETCSVGVARWDAEEGAASLLGRADAALYEAKHRGRNLTVLV